MNIFALSVFLVAVFADDYDSPRGTGRASQRGCVFPNIPQNVNIRTQGKGRVMRYLCAAGNLMVGKRFSTCLRGRWSSPPPICVSKGCPPQTAPPNGRVVESYDGGMLTFGCNPGYTQTGTGTIYCILPQWNGTAPTCTVPTMKPNVSCDFEDPDLCGWSHDVTHDFEWKRNKLSTPSGHVGTGPSFDHTLGKGLHGHYVYLEASAPQKLGDVTRLFSPVYPTVQSGSCFTFWYHMYGSSIGALRLYLKEENQVLAELKPVWSKDHETGNLWYQDQINVPQLTTNFQIVIEGVRGTDYMGDIAIDDVSLNPGSCPAQGNQSDSIQGNVTSATTTDEGGGPEVTVSQNATLSTTVTYTREVTTNLSLATTTKIPSIVGPTLSIPPVILSTMTSLSSNTSELVASTPSTSVVELTSAKAETTTSLTRPQQPDCVIDGSNSTRSTDENWVISLSNCSTSTQTIAPKTTKVSESTEAPTVDYRSTTIPPAAVITTPVKITSSKITQPYTYVSTTALQSTTTTSPTTTKWFTKRTQSTTTSLPKVSTTMRSTTNSESNPNGTTKRFPFIIKNPTTTTTTTTTRTIATTTADATTTKSSVIYTSSLPQSTASTTAATTTPIFVPDSSNLTATTASPVTTTASSVTTAKATSPPGTTTTSTRKPFIYIVPKTITTVTNNPLGSTKQTGQFKSTITLPPRTTVSSTQSSTSSKPSTPKRGTSLAPTKQVTTPSSTTDIRDLFPKSSESYSSEDGDSNEDTVSDPESGPDRSERWQEFPRRPHPREKETPGAGVSAIATACSLGALALVVSVFTIIYVVRRRKLKHQRFGSNSEMRYITQSEELEFGAPENTDMIRLL